MFRYDNLVHELDKMVEDGYYIPDGTDKRFAHNRHGHQHKAVIRTRVRKSNQMHQKKKRPPSDAGSRQSTEFSHGSEYFNEDEERGQDHANEHSNHLYTSSHSIGELSGTHNDSLYRTPASNSSHKVTPRNAHSSQDNLDILEESQQPSTPSGRYTPSKKNSLPMHLRPPSILIADSHSSDYGGMKIGKLDNPRLNTMIKELSKLKAETEMLRMANQTLDRDRKVEASQLNLQVSPLAAIHNVSRTINVITYFTCSSWLNLESS
jgi:hypothetical protein